MSRQILISLIVACAFFMDMLDGTVISTSLPQMALSFHERPVDLSIGMSAYIITLAIFIPASGWIADSFGSKRVFGAAIVIFVAASMLCGRSNGLWEFTAARIFQGIGGALMVPVGRLIVLRSSEKRDLVRNMQFLITPALIAPVIGPPLGGFITTFASWRWIFYLNLPIGIVGLALVAAFMSDYRTERPQRFDWLGFALTGSGLAALVFGLDQFARPDFVWRVAGTLTGAGLLLCVLAIVHLRRDPHPLLDLSLLRIPTFGLTTLFPGSAFRVVIGSTPFLWPLLFQVGFGMSAFTSGLVIMSCAAGDLGMKFFATQLLRRFGFRLTLVVNGIIASLAILLCALFTARTPVVAMVAVLFAIGIVRSVQFGSFNALAFVDVAPEQMSGASSLSSTVQQITWGFGIAFGAVALHLGALSRGDRSGAFAVSDVQLAFVAVAVLAFASALNFLRLDPHAGALASGHRPTGESPQLAAS